MNKTKLLAGITSMALMGAVAYYTAMPLNQAFAADESAQEGNEDIELALPEWIPDSYESALEFINAHGKTYTKDGLACVIAMSGEVPQISEATVVYEQGYSGRLGGDAFRIYVYQFSKELTVSANSHTYTFVNDNGTVTETDIFSWLPDSYDEFGKFMSENERISVHDDYIIFCDDSIAGNGYSWIVTEGEESVEKEFVSGCRLMSAEPATGGPAYSVRGYKPVSDGKFDLTWTLAREWDIKHTTENVASKSFIVSGGQISESTENGKFFDGMTADEFIEKAAESGELIKQETYDKFKETFGELSVHGKYVVFCQYYNCMNSNTFDNTGSGTLREIQVCKTDAPVPTGGSSCFLYILKADTPGEINLNVYTENHAYSAPKKLRYTANLKADEDLNITLESKEESKIAGDINSDGKADITDLSELALALVGDQNFTEAQQKAADVDGDGDVKLSDLAKFRQFLSKVIESLG